MRHCVLAATALLLHSGPACPETVNIAVASNFAAATRELADAWQAETGHEARLIPGSSGKHFAQISQGAPFDLFLSADSERPELLEKSGTAVEGSRFTYALGRIVLWRSSPGSTPLNAMIVDTGNFRRIAIANPDLAPYGAAARQFLEALGHWPLSRNRLVQGENVSQAFQFVYSGNADLGVIALSQVRQLAIEEFWLIPEDMHSPIRQQAVRLSHSTAAVDFADYLRSSDAVEIIRRHGYDTPDVQ